MQDGTSFKREQICPNALPATQPVTDTEDWTITEKEDSYR